MNVIKQVYLLLPSKYLRSDGISLSLTTMPSCEIAVSYSHSEHRVFFSQPDPECDTGYAQGHGYSRHPLPATNGLRPMRIIAVSFRVADIDI